MKLKTALRNGNTGRVVVVCLVIILLPVGYSAVRALMPRSDGVSREFLEMPIAAFQDCVEETSYMRLRHMDLLKELREDVIRHGVRGEISLEHCRRCHTSKARFCDRCHQAASVHLDCFGCHYYPEPDSASQEL
ncbi:MAG: hypothetical protein PVH40_09330 [Gemmatimonadales bacterium]|jgi:hypothetical protein